MPLLSPSCGHRPLQAPPSTRFPSTLAPAKPMEQAAAPKVPCTRAIVSRTRVPSTRSSRVRRQRGSSDTTSQSRYLWRAGGREVSMGPGPRGPGKGLLARDCLPMLKPHHGCLHLRRPDAQTGSLLSPRRPIGSWPGSHSGRRS